MLRQLATRSFAEITSGRHGWAVDFGARFGGVVAGNVGAFILILRKSLASSSIEGGSPG